VSSNNPFNPDDVVLEVPAADAAGIE